MFFLECKERPHEIAILSEIECSLSEIELIVGNQSVVVSNPDAYYSLSSRDAQINVPLLHYLFTLSGYVQRLI